MGYELSTTTTTTSTTTSILASIVGILLAYSFVKWLQNPLRRIPGPRGLPFLGNVLSITPTRLHMILYDWALKYGDVMKISVLGTPMVVINNTEIAYKVLTKTGDDFQGRPKNARIELITPKDLGFSSIEDPGYPERRSAAMKALKSYGDGVAHLENIIQETLADLVEDISKYDGQPLDTHQLSYGYLCCVITSVLFGEKYSYEDPECQSFHELNTEAFKAVDPFSIGALFDVFPFLLKQNILLKGTLAQIWNTIKLMDQLLIPKIDEAHANFDENDMKGVLDQLISAQKNGEKDGPSRIDDASIKGIITALFTAGMGTSLCVLCQVFLDLLHDPELQKKIQQEIDSQFGPNHKITLHDREKLPLLQAYILENLRYGTITPTLLPRMTIRDSEVAGCKIPANTVVLVNAFYIAHNPDVYDEPFRVKPERFLDADGNVVPPGHPARHNSLGFGSGKRVCIGKNLAESRIFLFLAHILQKFTIEPAGELPERDVSKYKLELVLKPPMVDAKFIRRQQ